ncbi:MAG: ATP-binding protein [Nanoarchaeota archaeon]|nr:ATP-binding protein [Nanoarchaeota archaeon]MBU1005169.1 ATP-binding protein [Nanoarchaeota archaeon]MBU1946849.1 ATP-binding protein [Nanoarchaeota archaeon]
MYIEREISKKFNKLQSIYPVIAIVGARQAGKTTFLKEHSKANDAAYLLFDDPDVRSLFDEDVKKFESQYLNNKVAVLDEVQYGRNAGSKLKYLADSGKKLWITSSSEIILGKEVLSYLVGRVSIIRLYPFSLQEFLNMKGQKEFTSEILKRIIEEHTAYGGYPKVAMVSDIELKKTILKDLYDTMVLKDIAQAFSIEDIRSLEDFSRYLAANVGGLISYDTLSSDLKISFQTLKKYLDAMEKSYLIAKVSPFYKNKSKEIIKQPKVYFVDTGLRNSIAREFTVDGKIFENYVLSELLKMGFMPKYWRTKSQAEVDFVIEKDNKIIPIEVKLNAESASVERSLNSFISEYKPKRAFVVFLKGNKANIRKNGCDVNFVDVMELRKSLMS